MIRSRAISERTLRALAVFGLPACRCRRKPDVRFAVCRAAAALTTAPCVLFTGPSGAGKSTALSALARLESARDTRTIRIRPDALARDERTPPEIIRRAVGPMLTLLSRCGLSDATLLATPARYLSEGQRWRLALCAALSRAARPGATQTLIIADELCDGLDELTALGVLAGAASICTRTPGLFLAGATARDDVAAMARGQSRWRVIDLPTQEPRP